MSERQASAFDKIKAGLEDAIAYAEGDTARGRVAAPNNAPVASGTHTVRRHAVVKPAAPHDP